jgi:hypothetical protein
VDEVAVVARMAGTGQSAGSTERTDSGVRPMTVVPSSAVMMEDRVGEQRVDPPVAFGWCAGPGGQAEFCGDGLAGAGDVPRFEPEPVRRGR